MRIVEQENFASIAFPLIGAGSGSFNQQVVKQIMYDEFSKIESESRVIIVEFNRKLVVKEAGTRIANQSLAKRS